MFGVQDYFQPNRSLRHLLMWSITMLGERDTESGDSANSTVSEHAWNVHQDIESPEALPET